MPRHSSKSLRLVAPAIPLGRNPPSTEAVERYPPTETDGQLPARGPQQHAGVHHLWRHRGAIHKPQVPEKVGRSCSRLRLKRLLSGAWRPSRKSIQYQQTT
eukprot:scaffold35627_cov31-Tisochrysis_lutea.AAC.2